MTVQAARWSTGHRSTAVAIFTAAGLYALATVAVEVVAEYAFVRTGSLLELSTELLSLGGLALAVVQLRANWRDARLRRGWMLAAAAMALLAVSEATDWLSAASQVWDDDYRYKLPLWLVAAVALWLCTRLYRTHPWVRFFLLAGFVLQSTSNVLDMADGDLFVMPFMDAQALEFATELTGLLAIECYVSALLFTRFGPEHAVQVTRRLMGGTAAALAGAGVWAPRAAAPVAIGSLARALFVERRMFRAARYPTRIALLHRPGFRQALLLAMAALFGLRVGTRVGQAGFRSTLRQLADLAALGIRQGIDAVSYYLYELYRPGGRRQAGYYLTRGETKNGLFTVLNASRPRAPDAPWNLTDKTAFRDACARAGIATPPILLTASDGHLDWHAPAGAFDRDLFAKLRRGRGTMRTGQYRRVAPLEYIDSDARIVTLAEVTEDLRLRSLAVIGTKTTPYIVQPRLRNHASLADLAEDSLIVFRVVTCLDRDDMPEVTHAMLRILVKIEPGWDAGADTEFGAAIDLDTGQLGQMTGDKPDSCLAWYDVHPVTGARVLGRRIEAWPELRALALKAHAVFRSRIVIGWDIAHTSDGPLMIEGNSNMDVSFIQRAYRDPIGCSRLGELLHHHLSRL